MDAMTDYAKREIAIEFAFNSLLSEAAKLGLHVDECLGLVYLRVPELTRNFQAACREILDALNGE